MRVALVSPYSWTYPGGVTRHIEALAGELDTAGHDVRVLSPFDADDRRTAWLHRGARPQRRDMPEWLVPLGGEVLAGGEELALVRGALLVGQPAPCGIDLEERVLDELTLGHQAKA